MEDDGKAEGEAWRENAEEEEEGWHNYVASKKKNWLRIKLLRKNVLLQKKNVRGILGFWFLSS